MYLFKCTYHIFLECPKRWKIIAKKLCAHFHLERTLTIMLGNFQNIISSILSNCKSWWEIWSNEMKVSNQVKLFITLNIFKMKKIISWARVHVRARLWLSISKYQLTEHSFTDRSALYRIPLELVKNRKLHNEKVFFWTF